MSAAPKIVPLTSKLQEWFPQITQDKQELFKLYMRELSSACKVTSLVPPKTLQAADQLHFADSILASQIIMQDCGNPKAIWDLGTGAGFPGLVMAILNPQVQFNLVDGDRKKTDFCLGVVKTLGLKNVAVHSMPVEKLPANSISIGVMRGLVDLSKSMFMLRTLTQLGGAVYSIKSDNWGFELSRVPPQLCSVWDTSHVATYNLPSSAVSFCVVRLKRI